MDLVQEDGDLSGDLTNIGQKDGAARAAESHSSFQNVGDAPSTSMVQEGGDALGEVPSFSDENAAQLDSQVADFNEQLEDANENYSMAKDAESTANGVRSHASGSAFGPLATFASDLQVLSSVVDVFATSWPSEFTDFCAMLRGFSLDLSTVLWFDCVRKPLSHVEKMYFQCSVPLFVVFAALAVFLVSKAYYKHYMRDPDAQGKINRLRVKLVHAATLSVFLTYAQICNYSFRTFQCISLTRGDGSIKWVIKSEPDLPCEGEEYEVMLTVAWVIIGFVPIGVPLVFGAMLLYSRHQINPPGLALQQQIDQRRKNPLAMQTSFLWNTYRPGLFVCLGSMLRGFILSCVTPLKTKLASFAAVSRPSPRTHSHTHTRTHTHARTTDTTDTTTDCYWFEIFESVYKLVMTGILVCIVYEGSILQFVYGLLVTVTSLCVHAWYRPHLSNFDTVSAMAAVGVAAGCRGCGGGGRGVISFSFSPSLSLSPSGVHVYAWNIWLIACFVRL
jgi:hypothetical protein